MNTKRLSMLHRRLRALTIALENSPQLWSGDIFGVFGPLEVARQGRSSIEGLPSKQLVGTIPDETLGQLAGRFAGDALGFAAIDPEMRAEGLQAIACCGLLTPGCFKAFSNHPETEDVVYMEGLRAAQTFFDLSPKETHLVFCGELGREEPWALPQVMQEVEILLARAQQQPIAQAA